MATRRDETDNVKKKKAAGARKTAPPRKTAPRKAAAAKKTKTPVPAPAKKEGLLRAGLKALDNVRNDVAKRQANVIESLLGIAQPKPDAPARGFPGLDSFGIRKFEDVFDQRVATAMQRLGMPSAQEIQELREQMRQLLAHLERIESGRRKR
ncbi:phasin family protein [Variovorax paradoxus]|nr:phasin family protein [Variovorax paradoxus]